MAILGFGDYLCEAYKHFNTDGNDGNHPFCYKQSGTGVGCGDRAIRLGEECPFIPFFGYTSEQVEGIAKGFIERA